MCSFREWGRYCVRIMTSTTPELTQLESVKSMIRYLPAKGTAGLARLSVKTPRREPSPPARITARVFMTGRRQRDPDSEAALPDGALVEKRVVSRGALPGEVFRHPAPLELPPCAGIRVHPRRATERISKRLGVGLVKHQTG